MLARIRILLFSSVTFTELNMDVISVLDPEGSALIWLSWIRIRMINTGRIRIRIPENQKKIIITLIILIPG
jgi:hypothetical protein